MKSNFSILTLFLFLVGFSQNTINTIIHSHNDYEQKMPFWEAYTHGANSIEADVFLKNGELYVTHEEENIKKENTFKKLYLSPIKSIFDETIKPSKKLILLIDIKSESKATLKHIIKELEAYKNFLIPYNPQGVKIVISGNRPNYNEYSQYPDYIFFDWQSPKIPKDLTKIAMLSLDFSEFSVWNGKGKIVAKEQKVLNELIGKAKYRGLPIRFWANPDTKSGWFALQKMGVDIIGTDHPAKAEAYFQNLNKNTVNVRCSGSTYQPTYQFDNANKKVKNVILIIGDGMGLAQISTASIICPNMMFNQFKSIGFSKTNSANDYTTDSAAGGTAMAIGEKTNNRAIGVDSAYHSKPNLVEIFAAKAYKTAVLTTDEITGATPASFYAHVEDRGMKNDIARYLIDSPLDFWMGGDRNFFKENKLNQDLENKGFTVVNQLDQLEKSSNKIAFLAGEYSLPYIRDGRGNLLPDATSFALDYLKNKNFFMMIEGAQIDNFGHFNDIQGVVEETVDLDKTIQKAIEFADKDGETLVIVTADHECGGLTLPHGDLNSSQLEGEFSTHDHTGIMVPVFAYGPMSSEFQGIYDNSEIFHKILKVIKISNQ